MDDHALAAQKAAERRLAICWEVMMASDGGDEGDLDQIEGVDELAGVFCGCETCVVREVLDAAWPHLVRVLWHQTAAAPN
jgi:hypothetical protein